ncbi:small ribosomal subunit protein uS15m [Bacillus rossius redtenbacheri]|uniref:small ribosomal subunit protein uS15m n=1 Tax=Bacillus rossius redtenbacheri TaxID=93214 RepID=UPI002FDD5487
MLAKRVFKVMLYLEKQVFIKQQCRKYAMKSDLKIKWVRPEKICCTKPVKSGDLETKENLEPNLIPSDFAKSEELKTANELVKKMFSLSFLPRKYTLESERGSMIERVRRHQLDTNSVETSVAKMTASIRNWQEKFEKNPHDKVLKVNLKELIEKRRKYLKLLRCYDYKRFEWLLEQLNVRYRPHPRQYLKVTRKDSLRKLTNKHCEDLKERRLSEYKALLEGQKLSFLQEKLETLQQFQKDEQELGLEQTVSDEDIEEVRVRIQKLSHENSLAESNIKS